MQELEPKNEIVPQKAVEQYLSTDAALKHYEEFEALKTKLLKEDDYQKIGEKPFIKKSGWRKLALVFNVSDEIVYAKRIDREDGDPLSGKPNSFLWEFTVSVKAPNGRSTEAIGSCDSKERRFAHTEHDVKATAHTRAKSRGISDLIGAGEVSAEEMDPEDHEVRNVTPSKESSKAPPNNSSEKNGTTLFQGAEYKK